ncbi:MAG: D-glycero-beta-D-manno-heptose 1,7-bisphosphate 7-phosphatase [Candidatus Omnitrophota bacterium]|nr:D-glycero-beta-D-manno-heptose 1,7-bisphosphate 7-phosphatase [Candidatus Omnitrophota bacterium]
MKKVIFIDRDGVINRDPGGWTKYNYVTKWDEFFFIPGSIEALRRIKGAGYKICLISNQGGISKGYFTQKDLDELSKRMRKEIEEGGGKIDELYYCPHHDKDNCECRKPKTGLIEQAAGKMHIDFKNTFMIGDSIRDVEAGKRMGMKTILVLSGKTTLAETRNWNVRPDYIKKNLLEAVELMLKGENIAE